MSDIEIYMHAYESTTTVNVLKPKQNHKKKRNERKKMRLKEKDRREKNTQNVLTNVREMS